MDEVEDFLAHHGVKGMKWGVRKKMQTHRANEAQRVATRAKNVSDLDPSNRFNARGARKTQDRADRLRRKAEGKETKEDEYQRKVRRVVAGVIVGGLLVAAFAPTMKVSSLPKTPSKSVSDIIKSTHAEQMSSLTRTFKEGHMNEAQYKQFSTALNARYARKIAEAMKGGL